MKKFPVRGFPGGTALQMLIVAAVLAVMLFPFYWIFSSSFKPIGEIMTTHPSLVPRQPTLRNYLEIFLSISPVRNFPRFLLNSLIVSLATAVISTLIAIAGGYALARYSFPGKTALSRCLLFVYVFPTVLLLVPIYQIMTKLGLLDKWISLVIVYTTLVAPFCAWLLSGFFRSIPIELEESGRVDGASRFGILFRILLPIAAPGVVTAAVYAFVTSWGEYMFALLLMFSNEMKTAPLGLSSFMAEQYIEWGPLLSGSVLVILPITIFFLPFAKYFVKGLASGAVKG
ncbi:MAG: carbohydrate ABC transporter permease [Patescibacteria group bacterium]